MSTAAISSLPVAAPLRQIHPTATAPEPLEDVETPVNQMQDIDTDGLDLREFRDLVRAFKEKRVGLGLTQTQAGMDLQGEADKRHHSFLAFTAKPDKAGRAGPREGQAKISRNSRNQIHPTRKTNVLVFVQLQRRPRGSHTVRASCAVWSGWM